MQSKLINKFPSGVVTPPPSKSISHRALICAALSGGADAIEKIGNLGKSDDIAATKTAIVQLVNGDTSATIDCKESGSTLRFLIPIAALSDKEWIFKGEGRLMQRPLNAYEKIFTEQSIKFKKNSNDELHIKGPLNSGLYELPGNISSQYISGLLFALPLLKGDSEIVLSTPLESSDYVKLTTDVMSDFGVEVIRSESGWKVPGEQSYKAQDYKVENDWSQAAFFLCAAALGRPVQIAGMRKDSHQGDRRIVDVLESAGVKFDIALGLEAGEFIYSTNSHINDLKAIKVDVSEIPDLVPPIAALAAYLRGKSHIVGASRLRYKESDRLKALQTALSSLGANIKEEGDSLIIQGSEALRGGRADAFGDHRIAMAVAVTSIGCEGTVELTGWESVKKSYPDFWKDFEAE